jgi:hypothetical protein
MKTLTAVCLFVTVTLVTAQDAPQKYWINFTAKAPLSFSKSAGFAEIAAVTGLSQRALQRRAKMSTELVSAEDLPVHQSHLTALHELGVDVQNTSRWFNAATAYLTVEQRNRVQQLPFVSSVEPVTSFRKKELTFTETEQPLLAKQAANKYSYGNSVTQMNLMNAVAVHNIGISGRGVLVGMLDTGFRWKTHTALQNLTVVGEYDFIQKDSSTANGAGDSGSQDSHGTSCMSLVGGYKDGELVSSAFRAHFMLGKTEYVPSETNVEEDNWIAAVEWMEANGVYVVSSSLGYKEFDAGQRSYVYTDMNGRTSKISLAAVWAARKGVVVCNAMGNEGVNGNPPSITMPADADSIISVGAVSSSGTVASFSSNGPTSDGRTKPDVSAQGISVYAALPSGTITGSFGGTSAATPLTAGVAAMILSARPELTPVQVRDALRSTASISATPNNTIGWGIVNAYQAVLYHGMVIGTDPEVAATPAMDYTVGIHVVSKSVINKDSVRLFYTINNGSTFTPLTMTLTETVDAATNSGKYTVTIPSPGSAPKFYVRAVDAANKPRTSPFAAPSELYDAKSGATGVRPDPVPPARFTLHQNYPNPFNPATVISYDVPSAGLVSLKVYDLLGREVRTLVNEVQPAASHSVVFDAAGLSAGVYLYRLQMDANVETRRMALVK